jgi:hypothetical protein
MRGDRFLARVDDLFRTRRVLWKGNMAALAIVLTGRVQ